MVIKTSKTILPPQLKYSVLLVSRKTRCFD